MADKVVVKDYTDQFRKAMDAEILKALETVGGFIRSEATDELENSPRRVDTGRLKGSITHEVNQNEASVIVGTNVEYAIYVHEGTRRMTPNRFLRNAVERNEDQIEKKIKDTLKHAESSLSSVSNSIG